MRTLLCTAATILTLILTSIGCVNYRYTLSRADYSVGPTTVPTVSAPDETMTVVKDRDLVVSAEPARLRLRQAESRCVVLIENPTDTEMTLDGTSSTLVDPLGQTRGIAGQLIPPGAFTKLVLPPLRDAPPTGPGFQFGLGVLVENTPRGDAAGGTPNEDRRPQYLDAGRPQDYWEWDGEGRIRLVLTFKQQDRVTRHAFVLTRTKQ